MAAPRIAGGAGAADEHGDARRARTPPPAGRAAMPAVVEHGGRDGHRAVRPDGAGRRAACRCPRPGVPGHELGADRDRRDDGELEGGDEHAPAARAPGPSVPTGAPTSSSAARDHHERRPRRRCAPCPSGRCGPPTSSRPRSSRPPMPNVDRRQRGGADAEVVLQPGPERHEQRLGGGHQPEHRDDGDPPGGGRVASPGSAAASVVRLARPAPDRSRRAHDPGHHHHADRADQVGSSATTTPPRRARAGSRRRAARAPTTSRAGR